MKKILLRISIGLFAMFCAGCITEDAGTAAAENPLALSPQGREMPGYATEDPTPPSEAMNVTPGSIEPGSMPPGPATALNAAGDRAMPPGTTKGTPGSMEPGSMPPREAPQERPDMIQTGIPRLVITGG